MLLRFQSSPLSEYLFLPWIGVALRGLFLRQAPTAGALIYTMVMITGSVSPLFMTAFSLLFCKYYYGITKKAIFNNSSE